jgi:SAM-dependent methyltransferase
MGRHVNDPKNTLVRSLLDQRIKEVAHYAWGDLLDVGCGTRPYEEYFIPYVTRYVGMDVCDPQYEKQREADGTAVDVYGSAERLPFKDGEFSTIVCFQVLEHLPHPWCFFSEVARVLSPKGVLILRDRNEIT